MTGMEKRIIRIINRFGFATSHGFSAGKIDFDIVNKMLNDGMIIREVTRNIRNIDIIVFRATEKGQLELVKAQRK